MKDKIYTAFVAAVLIVGTVLAGWGALVVIGRALMWLEAI